MNIVMLKGNLARDPELKYTPSGVAICNLTIAIGERYKNAAEEYVEKTHFFNCVCWGRRGEVLSEQFTKGRQIAVQGKLQLDQWENEAGEKRSAVKIMVSDWEFCGNKSDNAAAPVGGQGQSGFKPEQEVADIKEEEIPF
jgi:single-strand DNA-binding protein